MEGEFQEITGSELTDNERNVLTVAGAGAVLYGLSKRGTFGWAFALFGGSLIFRAMTGQGVKTSVLGGNARKIMAPPWRRPIRVQRSVTIMAPRNEVYEFWRNFENLPRFMSHLEEVRVFDPMISYWVAKAPVGQSVHWHAQVVTDLPGEQISWESLPGSMVPNKGTVRFQDTPHGDGTELRVSFEYMPPAGVYGATVAKLLGEEPQMQVDEDLQMFKSVMEGVESQSSNQSYMG